MWRLVRVGHASWRRACLRKNIWVPDRINVRQGGIRMGNLSCQLDLYRQIIGSEQNYLCSGFSALVRAVQQSRLAPGRPKSGRGTPLSIRIVRPGGGEVNTLAYRSVRGVSLSRTRTFLPGELLRCCWLKIMLISLSLCAGSSCQKPSVTQSIVTLATLGAWPPDDEKHGA